MTRQISHCISRLRQPYGRAATRKKGLASSVKCLACGRPPHTFGPRSSRPSWGPIPTSFPHSLTLQLSRPHRKPNSGARSPPPHHPSYPARTPNPTRRHPQHMSSATDPPGSPHRRQARSQNFVKQNTIHAMFVLIYTNDCTTLCVMLHMCLH